MFVCIDTCADLGFACSFDFARDWLHWCLFGYFLDLLFSDSWLGGFVLLFWDRFCRLAVVGCYAVVWLTGLCVDRNFSGTEFGML